MNKQFHILCVALLVALIITACGGDGDVKRALPPSAAKSAADLKVTAEREIEIEDGRILSLSPNGEYLAVGVEDALCVYAVDSMTPKSCAEPETAPFDRQSVAWSPDGTRVAFTENFIRYFHESDLWVLEVASGDLKNLTDDGVERVKLGSDGGKYEIDLSPAWSPDGKTLLFSRSPQSNGERQGTALYRVSAGGGDPKRLLLVDKTMPAVVWAGLHWSGDGKQIFYTVNYNKLNEPDNGVWGADRNGKNPQHILGMTDPEMGPPLLIQVAGQGDKALIWYPVGAGRYVTELNTSFYALLDLNTGDVDTLEPAQTTGDQFRGPNNATFSPDGSKILYSYRDIDDGFKLVVRDVDGGEENVLFTSESLLGASLEMGLGLNWADDDTIYVAAFGPAGFLLSVGTE